MTDLKEQTDLLIKALTQLHNDLSALNTNVVILGAMIFALLLIIAFRRK
jgi:hypothetical protein